MEMQMDVLPVIVKPHLRVVFLPWQWLDKDRS